MRSKLIWISLALVFGVLPIAASGQGSVIVGPLPVPDGLVGTSPRLDVLAASVAVQQPAVAGPGKGSQVPNMLLKPHEQKTRSGLQTLAPQGPDAVRQAFSHFVAAKGAVPSPAPSLSFEGTQDSDNPPWTVPPGFLIVPPDVEGDVGQNYYIQSNNGIFEIFDKTDGSSVLGPLGNNIFFAGTGTFCEVWNDGDPIVLYDHMADRWVFTQFALFDEVSSDPLVIQSYECFAVSATSDPMGEYHLYQFLVAPPLFGGWARFADYPKVGVWPDAYYMTSNDFEFFPPDFSGGFTNASAFAFDRQAMLDGEPAGGVQFLDIFLDWECADPNSAFAFSLQPSDLDGPPPPPGTPNTFVQAFDEWTWGCGDGTNDGYRLWDFMVDWDDPASSTFTDLGKVPTPDFDAVLCDFGPCVPQPDVNQRLDHLSQFTMFPARYRFFRGKGKGLSRSNRGGSQGRGGYGVMMVNSTVNAGGDTAGVRWAELRRVPDREDPEKVAGWKLHQVGTYAPDDGENRWMGSAAMNGRGAIAVSYSVSSDGTYPSIRYNTQARGGPKGMLTGGEESCFEGTGSQIGSTEGGECDPLIEQCRGGERWGDYSTISVDPSDDCSFWMTHEYYESTAAFDWHTRICKIDMCD